MKLWLIGALMVAVVAAAAPTLADAKRLGGGKPAGLQRNMPARTAPDAQPAKPATPAPAQQAAPGAAAAVPPAAAAPKRNWMGPLAGLAAGLGIAALFSHLGLGAGMGGGFMGLLLLVALGLGAFFLWRRFASGAGRAPAFAGMGGATSAPTQVAWPSQASARTTYEPTSAPSAPSAPSTVADSAPSAGLATTTSADPTATAATAATAATVNDAAAPITRVFVPASFDTEGFSRTAKMIFIRLQAANDTADLDDLRRFTTPELFASIRLDIAERGATAQSTDVLKVEAEVLDVAHEADRQVVSVRFQGQLLEEKGGTPTDFNEVWHLVKPNDDSRSWAIAGIEQVS